MEASSTSHFAIVWRSLSEGGVIAMGTPQQIHHPDRFFIGGAWVEPSSRAHIDVRDSATEEVFLSVAEAQVADVDRAVAAARTAFDNGPWPRLTHQERAVWLNKIADAWKKRTDVIADTWTRESGVLHSIAKHAPAE